MQITITKILLGITAAAVLTCGWLFTDLTLTKNALQEQRKLARSQAEIIETQNRITVREIRTNTIVREQVQAIEEAPNAETPIPPDVASAWAAAIDRVRDDAGIPNGAAEELPRPNPTKASR